MLRFKNYVKVQSLEEAYTLKQKKGNIVLGGMLWLKMQNRNVNTAIDLSGLGLNRIEETEDEFIIGCMTTLRQIETDPRFLAYTHGMSREAVRHIVGVQFRNLATVGGSIFGRFGFSDVLTFFLGMDTEVELFHGGRIPLEQFAKMPCDRDLLVSVHVKKTPLRIAYMTQRNTKTDFPVLACTFSQVGDEYRAVLGARPARAVVWHAPAAETESGIPDDFLKKVQEEVVVGSNTRASAEYRRYLAGILLRRCEEELMKQSEPVNTASFPEEVSIQEVTAE